MMPTYIEFHKKLIYAIFFITKESSTCSHNMNSNGDKSYCKICGADYFEAIEYKFEYKELVMSRDILAGKYSDSIEKSIK